MANRINTKRPFDTAKDGMNAVNFESDRSTQRSQPFSVSDDLIIALANAYENKRAQQVTEWERLGYQSVAGGMIR
jgi:hypothetical protein